MDIAPALAVIALTALVTFSPITRVPIGVLAGMYVLYSDVAIITGALFAAFGVTLGRIALALAAKAPRHERRLSVAAKAREEAMRSWLGSNPQFARISFLMGALPFVPSRVTFPMLGAIGAPLRWAVLGSLSGSVLVLSVTTWLSADIAVGVAGDDDALNFLGLVAATLIVLRLLGAIDGDAWRNERKLRLREEKPPFNLSMFGPGGTGPGTGGFGGMGGYPGAGAGGAEDGRDASDDGGEFYEGEVVGEEIIGDAGDEPGSSRGELHRGDDGGGGARDGDGGRNTDA